MKKIFGIIIAIVLTTSIINAEESEAKKLCDIEIKSDKPDIRIVQKQCLNVAKKYEQEKKYEDAVSYYFLSEMSYLNKSFELFKKYNKNSLYYYDKGMYFLLKQNKLKAKKILKKYITENTDIFFQQLSNDLDLFYKLKMIDKNIYTEFKEWDETLRRSRIGSGELRNDKLLLQKARKLIDRNHPETLLSAIEIYKKVIAKQTGFIQVKNLSKVASFYEMINDYKESYGTRVLILQKIKTLYGVMFQLTYLSKLVRFNLKYKDDYQAQKNLREYFKLYLLEIEKYNYLPIKEQKKYIKSTTSVVNFYLKNAFQIYNVSKNKKYVTILFTSYLGYKGSIFDSENAIATLYANTQDKTLKEKIDSLVSSKRYLAKLYQSLPKPKEKKQWQSNIKQTEEKIATLTKEIATKAQSFKEQQGLKDISFQDISKNLKEDELYIDYARAGEYYYVFTLDSKEQISFEQIDANSSKKIDTLVKTFREDVNTILNDGTMTDDKLKQLTTASKKKLSKLYTLVIATPLKGLVESKKSLILSPDGALKLLPFEALYDEASSKYFIENKNIRYIPSGKELVRLYKYGQTNTTNKSKKAVVFSNPNFDAKDITTSKNKEEEVAITPNTSRAGIVKSLFKMRFAPLPGTKAEAQSIKATLKETTTIQEYKEEEANEANLLKVKQPNILHIATHGFFINDNSIPNPMLKSGIALSGANASAIKGKSDGIVTALKLSGLKLKGTDLVVLSACQTGVVDINSTDSVSGLSKAFIQAGAKDIVMSLWSVNDRATKDLMSSFYKEMQNHSSYAKALQEAKLKMIEQGMHPFYWAPFVVSGL